MDVSDIFFPLAEGEGGVRGAGRRGDQILIENPRRGGVFRVGGAEGPGRVSAVNWGIGGGGGGVNFFFFGAEMSTELQNNLARQKITSRNQMTSRGYFCDCFKRYFGRALKGTSENKDALQPEKITYI